MSCPVLLPGGKFFFKLKSHGRVFSMSSCYLAEMRGISKSFPGVTANNNIDFGLIAGEIHCLLGENGSGKSTLMTVLSGLYHPDAGQVFINGNPVALKSPRDAIKAGIGMVHQHFKLVEAFTVAQNIVLGDRKLSFVPDMEKVEAAIAKLSQQYGLAINPRAKVWQLSVGERQRVEIVKMLYRGCEILILDEPTAVLTPQETRELFTILRVKPS
jgi:simple sugar transport system ATP-binding protein